MWNMLPKPEDIWPRCARCDMPVEEFHIQQDFPDITMTAVCHGDMEIIKVPERVWADVDSSTIAIGTAFSKENSEENKNETMVRASARFT